MFFLRRRRKAPVSAAWDELAGRLGLVPAQEFAPRLVDLLDLPGDEVVNALYRARGVEEVDAYLFGHLATADPRTREVQRAVGVLVSTRSTLSPTSWRVSAKLHELIASLQASKSGGRVVMTGHADFDDLVTVVSRHPEAVVPLLTPFVRELLIRSVGRGPGVRVTVGEGTILLTCLDGQERVDLAELLLSDSLSLYAALRTR